MNKKIMALLLAAAASLMVSACASEEPVQQAQTSPDAPAAVEEAEPKEIEEEQKEEEQTAPSQTPDPEGALDEIYKNQDRNIGLVVATDKDVTDVLNLNMDAIEEYHIRYLKTDFGASDVYIIKPKEGMADTVRDGLKKIQEERIRAFADYDIYNSTEISENAIIFSRGGYVVMLMTENNEAARQIIENHIPEVLDISK